MQISNYSSTCLFLIKSSTWIFSFLLPSTFLPTRPEIFSLKMTFYQKKKSWNSNEITCSFFLLLAKFLLLMHHVHWPVAITSTKLIHKFKCLHRGQTYCAVRFFFVFISSEGVILLDGFKSFKNYNQEKCRIKDKLDMYCRNASFSHKESIFIQHKRRFEVQTSNFEPSHVRFFVKEKKMFENVVREIS